jgi:RHS repeat-associated protein
MCGKKKTYILKNSDFAGNTAFVADRAYHRDKTNPLNNVLAVYEQVKDTITWTEQHLYGSSRHGMVKPRIVWKPEDSPEPGIPYFKQNKNQVYGARRYEITNHLGNVAAVISDRKMPFVHQTNVFFDAVVHSAADYFPFGSMMTGRTFSAGGYRYGFNSMEKDDEVKGTGNSYTTFYRQLDVRLGRWLSIDPEAPNLPWQSPYVSMDNNPILLNDPFGNSTFTDREGNVLHIEDDDDLGIYKLDVGLDYDGDFDKANAIHMGESWTPFSFADFEYYEEAGNLIPGKGAKIDFESTWATDKVSEILEEDPLWFNYAMKAKGGGDWDIKVHSPHGVYFGSKLFGKYASARDAGNFAAGTIAQKSMLPNLFFDYGYGAYNMAGNSIKKTALSVTFDLFLLQTPQLSFIGAGSIYYKAKYGEDKLSQMGINAGKKYVQKQE